MRFTDLKETVNHDVFNPAFNDTQIFDGLTYRATSELDHQGKPQFVIKVFDNNYERVGLVKFALYKDKTGNEWLESLISAIQPEYQGKGIASHIYAYARMLGNTVKPSSDQTAQGRAMWSAWAKSGDAKHLTSNESKFSDYERAVMEGGHSLEKQRSSALRQAITNEGFDQPYPFTWEDSEYGDTDALAKLPDGSNLSIMFNRQQDEDGEEAVQIEFYRNNSQEVTGEGDAQRVFATVIAAIQKYIKQHSPLKLTFSASKLLDPTVYYEPDEPQPNPESRAKLYDRLIQRYSRAWGYRAFRADTHGLVIYELSRLKPVAENFADGKNPEHKGDSKRHGIPKHATLAQLDKIAHEGGRRGQLAHWQANMRRGRAKNESEILEDLEEGWRDWVAGAALGAAALSPQTADAKSSPQQKPAITQQVKGDAAYATKLILKPEATVLIRTAQAAGMKGKELAQFVAQCAHETANFTSLKELGGNLDFKKYDPKHNPRKAKILGNKQVGDGAKYHGRGYIQLTGRDNYRRAGKALGLPLEQQPELVERPEVAARVAVWFWQNQVAPKVNNFNDTAQVTKPINPGLKGLDDRHNKYASIMALMSSKS